MTEQFQGLKPEVQSYLDRIGFRGPLDGSAETLARLQECHLHTVPYENLDIVRRIPLSLEIPDLLEKIVVRRRGGYCFELNALFGWLLRELGYSVTDYLARFWREESNPPPKRRHQVLKVEAQDEVYLCDVGVGGIVPRRPIRMTDGLEHQQADECYKLLRDVYFGWVLCEWKNEQWQWLYSFTEEPQLPKDFTMATYWCEHAPDSIFINKSRLSIRTHEGRNTVFGDEFRIFTLDGVRAFVPQSETEYEDALCLYFGIVL